MFICPNCKKISETPINFCTCCGARMEAENTAYIAPVNEAVPGGYNTQNTIPDANDTPEAPKPSKAKAIVGMALSAAGFINAATGILYALGYMATETNEFTFMFTIIMCIITLPLSLVGLILSSKSRKAGDLSIFTKLGRLFGILGIIASAILLSLGIIALIFGSGTLLDGDYNTDDFGDFYF